MPFVQDPSNDFLSAGFIDRFWNDAVDFITGYRILRVPLLNWGMILAYTTILGKWTFHFREFHAFNSLLTTIFTNLLLYGLADTLAQTLRSASAFSASVALETSEPKGLFSYVVQNGRPRRVILDEEDDDLVELGLGIPQRNPDQIDQQLTHPEIFNFRRWALFSCWGAIISFVQNPWYKFLNYAFGEGIKFISVLQRVLCDQLFYSPISLSWFLAYMVVVVEGRGVAAIGDRLRSTYLPTLAVQYTIWPAAQFINFLVIPPALQIPFSSTVSVFWNSYLSLKNPS